MSTTESTSIDEKKAEDSGNSTDKADWKGFSKSFSHALITGIFFGVVVIGSMGLFLAKVANANILPTDCDIEPYPLIDELVSPRVVPIEIIHMNPVKILSFFGINLFSQTDKNSYYIQEANFVNTTAKLNFMDGFKNSWLCYLKNKAYPSSNKIKVDDIVEAVAVAVPINTSKSGLSSSPTDNGPQHIAESIGASHDDTQSIKSNIKKLPKNSPFWAYEFETLKKMTCVSFSIINSIFFYMNYLPEWATMIIFGLFFSVIITVIFFANWVYGLWPHLSNFGDLVYNLYNPIDFNKGFTGIEEPKWYKTWILYPVIVYFYFIGAICSAFFISPTIVTLYAFFKALGANYVVRDKNNKDIQKDAPKQNVFSFIKNTLYYKKTFLIILVMLNLMGVTNEYLGTSYLSGVIIACLILIFGLKILEINTPDDLCEVTKTNFPPLKQPEVDLVTVYKKVNMCDDKPTEVIIDPQLITTVTGYANSDVLDNKIPGQQDKGGSVSFRGGRSVKPSPKPSPKPKTKIYNLKLV